MPRINPDKLLAVLERLFKELQDASNLSRNLELSEKLDNALGRLELVIHTIASLSNPRGCPTPSSEQSDSSQDTSEEDKQSQD